MITETMNFAEIKEELKKDFYESNVLIKASNRVIANQNKYRRIALKHPERHLFKEIIIQGKRLNDFYVLPISRGKSEFKKVGIQILIACPFRTKRGWSVASLRGNPLDKSEFNITVYSAHLIHRYEERFCHKESTQFDSKAYLHFLAANDNVCIQEYSSEVYGDQALFAECAQGVLLGKVQDGVDYFKTFVTKEMLKGKQIDNAAEQQTAREAWLQESMEREHALVKSYKLSA